MLSTSAPDRSGKPCSDCALGVRFAGYMFPHRRYSDLEAGRREPHPRAEDARLLGLDLLRM